MQKASKQAKKFEKSPLKKLSFFVFFFHKGILTAKKHLIKILKKNFKISFEKKLIPNTVPRGLSVS